MSPLIPWGAAVLALAIGASGTLWYRSELMACQAAPAIEAAKAAELVRAQQERDAKFTRDLEETLRPIVRAVQEQGNATQVALAKVKSDPNCARTPAAAAFDSIVRPAGGGQAGAGPKDAARP